MYHPQINYQFLKKCVESAPVTDMQQELFDHILMLIPEDLRNALPLKDYIAELFVEVRNDFDESMKKSMG